MSRLLLQPISITSSSSSKLSVTALSKPSHSSSPSPFQLSSSHTLENFTGTHQSTFLPLLPLPKIALIPSFCTPSSSLLLLPLSLFYSSLPTTFFLLIASIIWRSEYLPPPSLFPSPSKGIIDFTPYLSNLNLLPSSNPYEIKSEWGKWIVSFSRAELRSGLAQVGSNRGWASEAVLRKGVGGSSAVVAVSGESLPSSYLSERVRRD